MGAELFGAELEKELWNLIVSLSKKAVIKTIQVGTAVAVTNTTCTVKRDDQPDLLEVRLNAIDDDLQTYATNIPKEGSSVLVAIIENIKTEAIVISCSEVDKIMWKAGNAEMVFDANGFKFKKGSDTLFKIIDDLFTGLVAWVPAGVVDAAAMGTLKNRLQDLLK